MFKENHFSEVHLVKFSKSGNYIASASHDQVGILYDEHGNFINPLVYREPYTFRQNLILDLDFSFDDKFLVTGHST